MEKHYKHPLFTGLIPCELCIIRSMCYSKEVIDCSILKEWTFDGKYNSSAKTNALASFFKCDAIFITGFVNGKPTLFKKAYRVNDILYTKEMIVELHISNYVEEKLYDDTM